MDLHHPRKKPDWLLIESEQRNTYQKVAAKTYGVVTPANIITLLGFALVIYGAWLIIDEVTLTALSFIAVGRIVDIVDGVVADKTGTKSSVGEAFDSVADKLSAATVLIVLLLIGIFDLWMVLLLLLIQLINSVATLRAKLSHKTIHSSLAGKQATFFLWMTVGLYTFGHWLDPVGVVATILNSTGIAFFWLAIIRGAQASYGYVVDILN